MLCVWQRRAPQVKGRRAVVEQEGVARVEGVQEAAVQEATAAAATVAATAVVATVVARVVARAMAAAMAAALTGASRVIGAKDSCRPCYPFRYWGRKQCCTCSFDHCC